jgi:hypothetical protein
MKSLIGVALLGLAFQAPGGPRPAPIGVSRTCSPTEHMPILGFRSPPVEPMPVFRPDSAWRNAMPTSRLLPCYLADSAEAIPLRLPR